MGSEKKRKRVSVEPTVDDGTPSATDKAERKRLKKLKKEAAAAAAAAAAETDENGMVDVKTETPNDGQTHNMAQIAPLVSPIATPMAGRKLTKRLFKLIEHAAKEKALRRGIKEVVLALRKSDTGIVVMAGDVFPVDVIAHVPLLCEEANVPYCFVSRKVELGSAGLTKRPTSVVLVSNNKAKNADLKRELDDLHEEVKAIQNLY